VPLDGGHGKPGDIGIINAIRIDYLVSKRVKPRAKDQPDRRSVRGLAAQEIGNLQILLTREDFVAHKPPIRRTQIRLPW